jgi:pyruvate dehydrogenase E1 component beta subunit
MAVMTYGEAGAAALAAAMRDDPRIVALGEDLGRGGNFGQYKGLLGEFGAERVIDTPISEATIVGAGVGMALAGLKPVVEMRVADFALCAMDEMVNQAAKNRFMFGGQGRVPLVMRLPIGVWSASAAQHSQSLEAWFAHIPGLKVVVPSTPADAKGLLKTAIRDDNPVIFLEHKVLYFTKGEVPEGEYTIPFGVADVKREGTDVTVVGIHTQVLEALQAAEELAEEGISVEVIDPRTVSPLDVDTIVASVKKTGRLVVSHQAYEQGGVGGEIVARVVDAAFDYLDAPPQRVCGKNVPLPYAATLERAALPYKDDIIAAIRRII